MSVAVVGATGFLGRALVRALESSGTPVVPFNRAVPFLTPDGRAAEGLASARTVYWLATQINPQIAEQEPDKVAADRASFEGFLDAMDPLDPATRVVLVSSGGTVYDPATLPPYAETAPTRPLSAYGRAKLQLEALLERRRPPGTHVALRVANAYGPGQPAAGGQGVIAYWLRAARRGEDIALYGDPATSRDYVYVDDVAQGLLAVDGAAGPLPPVVNIGSGRGTSLQELADTVLAVVDDPGLRLVVSERRSFDVPHTWLDVALAEQALGWRPKTTLRAGVEAAWASLAEEPRC